MVAAPMEGDSDVNTTLPTIKNTGILKKQETMIKKPYHKLPVYGE